MPGPTVRGFLWRRHALERLRAWLTPANADVIERTLAIVEARAPGIAAELDVNRAAAIVNLLEVARRRAA